MRVSRIFGPNYPEISDRRTSKGTHDLKGAL